jgi:hypothetical protein
MEAYQLGVEHGLQWTAANGFRAIKQRSALPFPNGSHYGRESPWCTFLRLEAEDDARETPGGGTEEAADAAHDTPGGSTRSCPAPADARTLPPSLKRKRAEDTQPSQATETQELTFEFKGSGKKQTWQCFDAATQLELNLLALAAVKCQQSQTKRMRFGDELQWLYDETIFDPRDWNYQTCIVGEQTSRDTGKVREVRAKGVHKGWGLQDALL